MKKLVLTFAAVGLFFTATQAQVTENPENTGEEATQSQVAEAGDDYEKIELAELPEAVTTAITRDFAEATTQEAWVKQKDEKTVYKIKLDVNGEEKTLYADAEGNWIDKKHKDKNKDS